VESVPENKRKKKTFPVVKKFPNLKNHKKKKKS